MSLTTGENSECYCHLGKFFYNCQLLIVRQSIRVLATRRIGYNSAMQNERTISFTLILDGEELFSMLGYELPRIGEHLAVEGKLYEVKQVARQYMQLHWGEAREESRAAVTVEHVKAAGYATAMYGVEA